MVDMMAANAGRTLHEQQVSRPPSDVVEPYLLPRQKRRVRPIWDTRTASSAAAASTPAAWLRAMACSSSVAEQRGGKRRFWQAGSGSTAGGGGSGAVAGSQAEGPNRG